MKVNTRSLSILFALLLASPLICDAQLRDPEWAKELLTKKRDVAAQTDRDDAGTVPHYPDHAYLKYGYGDRTRQVGISRANPAKGLEDPFSYVHKPLWTLRQTEDPLAGWPDIVHDVLPTRGGYRIFLEANLSTKNLRVACRDAVLKQDTAYLNIKYASAAHTVPLQDLIEVKPVLLLHAVVECGARGSRLPLAIQETNNLRNETDIIAFSFDLPDHAADAFKRLEATGQLEFTFYYSYSRRNVESGYLELESSSSVRLAVEDALGSERLAGDALILQTDVDNVNRIVETNLTKTVRATSVQLFTLVNAVATDLTAHVFKPANELQFSELNQSSVLTEAKLAEYLRPLVDRVSNTKGTYSQQSEGSGSGSTTAAGGKIGGIYKGAVGSLSLNLSKSQWDMLEEISGVTFSERKEGETIKPHNIKHYSLRDGWDERIVNERADVHIDVGSAARYVSDSPIAAWFTVDMLNEFFPSQEDLPPLATIPPGVAFPYFGTGDKPPKGYAFCDGKSYWPQDAAWLPKHLWGKVIPDLTGYPVYGTSSINLVGMLGGQVGAFTLPAEQVIITGESFEVQSTISPPLSFAALRKLPKEEYSSYDPGFTIQIEASPVGGAMYGRKHTVGLRDVETPESVSPELQLSGKATFVPKSSLDYGENPPPHYLARWIVKITY